MKITRAVEKTSIRVKDMKKGDAFIGLDSQLYIKLNSTEVLELGCYRLVSVSSFFEEARKVVEIQEIIVK